MRGFRNYVRLLHCYSLLAVESRRENETRNFFKYWKKVVLCILVWQLSSRTGATAFVLDGDEANYCDVSVVSSTSFQ